jgi:hypothetical protein
MLFMTNELSRVMIQILMMLLQRCAGNWIKLLQSPMLANLANIADYLKMRLGDPTVTKESEILLWIMSQSLEKVHNCRVSIVQAFRIMMSSLTMNPLS